VTVSAVETKLADVELVAVRNGLNGTVAHVRVLRGKEVPDTRGREYRTEAAHEGSHDRELVPPGGEDLGQWLAKLRLGPTSVWLRLAGPRAGYGTVTTHLRAPKKQKTLNCLMEDRESVDCGAILSTNAEERQERRAVQ
jgi:hypothetical protein